MNTDQRRSAAQYLLKAIAAAADAGDTPAAEALMSLYETLKHPFAPCDLPDIVRRSLEGGQKEQPKEPKEWEPVVYENPTSSITFSGEFAHKVLNNFADAIEGDRNTVQLEASWIHKDNAGYEIRLALITMSKGEANYLAGIVEHHLNEFKAVGYQPPEDTEPVERGTLSQMFQSLAQAFDVNYHSIQLDSIKHHQIIDDVEISKGVFRTKGHRVCLEFIAESEHEAVFLTQLAQPYARRAQVEGGDDD